VKPLQISAETAIKLSKMLNVPIEHLMHMPQHILIQKIMELEKEDKQNKTDESLN
jgi:plasmid maintenance system antidote protein VapI